MGEGSIEGGMVRCPWHGWDYDPVTGLVTVTFEPGETSREVRFTTHTDDLEEGTEQFLALLSNPTNATIADGTGVVEITDVFTPPAPPEPPEPTPRARRRRHPAGAAQPGVDRRRGLGPARPAVGGIPFRMG